MSQPEPVIHLFGHVGTALILEWPSGVSYSNQTMGNVCMNPSIEGVLVPIGNDVEVETNRIISVENELFAYFDHGPHEGTGAQHGLTIADADVIDALLAARPVFHGIRVDRTRLADSHEAWVHVTVDMQGNPWPHFEGFDPSPSRGVLTWSNSD